PGQSLSLQVAGQGGVPAPGVSAVVMNLTATNPASAGWLSAFPSGLSTPPSSNLNFPANATVANRAIVSLGPDGKVTIYNGGGRVDVIVDITGWFSDGTDATLTLGEYTGTIPTRILDTRSAGGPITPGQTMVTVAGMGPVPAMGAPVQPRAVLPNVTAQSPPAGSLVRVSPRGPSQPPTSALNLTPGATATNLVAAAV